MCGDFVLSIRAGTEAIIGAQRRPKTSKNVSLDRTKTKDARRLGVNIAVMSCRCTF